MPKFEKIGGWLLLALSLSLTGCVHLLLSPRQQVVKSALDAMCQTKNVQALAPFVTDDLRLVLGVSEPLVGLLDKFGIFRLSDEIASACHDANVAFADEIKVRDDRYIVRLSSKDKKTVYEFVVVKDNSYWKISSLKK